MKKIFQQTLLAVVFAATASAASAATIISGAGLGDLTVGANADHAAPGAGTAVTITPHPAWQTNDPLGNGAAWVSYADTGQGGLSEGNHLTGAPDSDWIFSISETFIGTAVDLKIWADDTAQVFLDGVLQKAWNTTQGTCAVGSIGCQPNEFFNLLDSGLGAGPHTIRIDVYQIGGGPHGVLYSGSYAAVPLPAALPLFAGALGLFGLFGWRRKRLAA